MPVVARALATILLVGSLVLPDAQLLLCAAPGTAAMHAGMGHEGHREPGTTNLLNVPGHGSTCHELLACGLNPLLPLPSGARPVPVATRDDRPQTGPATLHSTVLAAPAPPPKR